MTCITCANATVKSPTGGKSAHRETMLELGFTGCKADRQEFKTYGLTVERECRNWEYASATALKKRGVQ